MISLGGWRSQIIWCPETLANGTDKDSPEWRYHVEKLGPFASEGEVQARIDQLADETTELLKKHWLRVEALASESLERNFIPGEEAERIITAVSPTR
jgi:hypothetical protein